MQGFRISLKTKFIDFSSTFKDFLTKFKERGTETFLKITDNFYLYTLVNRMWPSKIRFNFMRVSQICDHFMC